MYGLPGQFRRYGLEDAEYPGDGDQFGVELLTEHPGARIAAGSVVIKPVPNNVTVAGVPAKVVGEAGCPEPARSMDQMFPSDP